MKIVAISNGRALFPRDEASEEIIQKLRRDEDVVCSIYQERDAKQLKAIHALLGLVAKNHPEYRTIDSVKRYLKVQSKMFRPIVARDGRLYFELESISPDKMDHAKFSEVWEQWRQIISADLLPGITSDELAMEILERL